MVTEQKKEQKMYQRTEQVLEYASRSLKVMQVLAAALVLVELSIVLAVA